LFRFFDSKKFNFFQRIEIIITFTLSSTNRKEMSIFGIVLFLLIGGMAFWMLLFLMGFILPFWITLGIFEKMRPKRIFDDSEA
jgi:hypothetical protein